MPGASHVDTRSNVSWLARGVNAALGFVRILLIALTFSVASTAAAAEPDLSTPRRTLRFFVNSARMHDYATAAHALDLRDIPQERWAEEGPVLSRELELVFSQERRFDWDRVSDKPEGDSTDGRGVDVIGTVMLGGTEVPVRLVRMGDGTWRFGSGLVAVIPPLYEAYGPGWLGEHVPEVLNDFGFLDLAAWQWLGILLGLIAALFIAIVLGALGRRVALGIVRRTRATWDDRLVEAASGPTRLVVGLSVFAAAVHRVHLGVTAHKNFELLLRIAAIVAFCWCLLRAMRFLAEVLGDSLAQGDGLIARSHLTQILLLRRIGGLVVILLCSALVLLQFEALRSLGTSLLASAGVAGIVIGLAAQRPMSSLLAGLQLSLTQPVRLGDVVVIEGEWGRIEEITLTYVVVKIWDLRRLVVPITKILDAPFQNWTRAGSDLFGTVFLHADYRVPVDEVRQELERFVAGRPEWDGKQVSLSVTNVTDRAVELRALVSASDSDRCWDLRCAVREHLLAFLQKLEDGAVLPRTRFEPPPTALTKGT